MQLLLIARKHLGFDFFFLNDDDDDNEACEKRSESITRSTAAQDKDSVSVGSTHVQVLSLSLSAHITQT